MKVSVLLATHPTYDAGLWQRYDALYRGGDTFRQSVASFLPRLPDEPDPAYDARKVEAHYCGYVGPLLDWFRAKLLSAPLVIRAKDRKRLEAPGPDAPDVATDSWYAGWKEDVDGVGTDLVDFLGARFTEACVKGRAWWLVEAPDDEGIEALSVAAYDARGLGDAVCTSLQNEQVLDFEVDARGQLEWAIVHSYEQRRQNVNATRSRIRETWRVYDRVNVETWAVEYDPALGERQPEEAVLVGKVPHRFHRVPLVRLGFVGCRGVRTKIAGRTLKLSSSALEGFWLMQRLADAQIAHFRMGAALDWNIRRVCYAQCIFKTTDPTKPPVMGGFFVLIGTEEEVEWISPPSEHLPMVAARVADLKSEIYQVGNQMAQGIDIAGANAVGRSADSKQADASSTEVILRIYGALLREATEQTYELLSQVRGDTEKITWSVEGLDTFSLVDAETVIDTALAAAEIDLPSPTLRREIDYRVADALLPGCEQATRDAVRKEIDAALLHAEDDKDKSKRSPPFGSHEDDDEQDMDALHMTTRDDDRRIALPPEMLAKLRFRQLGKLGTFAVWAVNGNSVRLLDTDFSDGGNPSRHAYIAEGELWIDQRFADAPADLAATVLHQAIEAVVMEDGSVPYPAAHAAASAMEEILRKAFATGATSADSPAAALAVAAVWLPALTKAAQGLAASSAKGGEDDDESPASERAEAAGGAGAAPAPAPAAGAKPAPIPKKASQKSFRTVTAR